MIICMCSRVYVERSRQLGITLKFEAFIVAVQCLLRIPFRGLRSQAFDGLFLMLALTCHEGLCLTRSNFFTRIWSMARVGTGVVTDCFLAPAQLCACRSRIFTLAYTVAGLLAEMNSTFQFLATRESAANFREPAWLFFNVRFPHIQGFSTKKGHLGHDSPSSWRLMLDLRVSTIPLPSTFKGTWWRAGSTWLWWM